MRYQKRKVCLALAVITLAGTAHAGGVKEMMSNGWGDQGSGSYSGGEQSGNSIIALGNDATAGYNEPGYTEWMNRWDWSSCGVQKRCACQNNGGQSAWSGGGGGAAAAGGGGGGAAAAGGGGAAAAGGGGANANS